METPPEPSPEAPAAALGRLRVLEVGSLIAGPFAGRLLADHGADVIKIEPPDRPDPLRTWGQAEMEGEHVFWTVHARNKRCITLDLRCPPGQALFLRMAERADVVIESLRPGTFERWNLGWERLHRSNPRLVFARLSGYGQDGPRATWPGFASAAEAVAGLRFLNGYPDQPPPRMALSLGDSLAGMFAVQGILMALLAREHTGEGQVVDTALSDSCLAMLESTIPDYSLTGHVRQPSGTRLDGIAPSNLYRSADSRWVVIAANQDTVFSRLCKAMGDPMLATDPRFADHLSRGRHQDELDTLVADWAGRQDAATILSTLEEHGVVVGLVNSVAEVVKDEQFRARGMLVEHFDRRLGRSVLGPGIVPRLSATPGSVRWAGPPRPGVHNEEVYAEFGLTPGELAHLGGEGVL